MLNLRTTGMLLPHPRLLYSDRSCSFWRPEAPRGHVHPPDPSSAEPMRARHGCGNPVISLGVDVIPCIWHEDVHGWVQRVFQVNRGPLTWFERVNHVGCQRPVNSRGTRARTCQACWMSDHEDQVIPRRGQIRLHAFKANRHKISAAHEGLAYFQKSNVEWGKLFVVGDDAPLRAIGAPRLFPHQQRRFWITGDMAGGRQYEPPVVDGHNNARSHTGVRHLNNVDYCAVRRLRWVFMACTLVLKSGHFSCSVRSRQSATWSGPFWSSIGINLLYAGSIPNCRIRSSVFAADPAG